MAGNETEEKCVFTFLWLIENFSSSAARDDSIHSPSFSVRGLKKKWRLEIDPFGFKRKDECFCVLLYRMNKSSTPLPEPIYCEISFLEADGVTRIIKTARNQYFGNAKRLEFRIKDTEFDVLTSSILPMDTLRVQCRMWKSIGNFDMAGHCLARTGFSVERSSILCRIQEFCKLELDEKRTYTLEDVSISLKDCRFNIYLIGPSIREARLKFDIHAFNTYVPLLIKCKVSILDRSGNKVFKCAEGEEKLIISSGYQFLFLPQTVTMEGILKSPVLDEGTLNLICEYTFLTGEYNGVIEDTYYSSATLKETVDSHYTSTFSTLCSQNSRFSVDHPNIFQQKSKTVSILQGDFLSLYRKRTSTDFELHSGDVPFAVHKIVLSARSPFFRDMFSGDMKESKFLDVPDVDPCTLNRMLTFLYSGIVDALEWENTLKLYFAADKYQVLSLKQECNFLLRSSIDISNVCDILTLANQHQDDELESFVDDFFLRHFDEIMTSPEWVKFLERENWLAWITMRRIYLRKLAKNKAKV